MTPTLTEDAVELPVRRYAQLLRAVHELIVQGKGDSPEAESLADEMDAPWYAMTEQELERMRGLSEDMYTLAAGGAQQAVMSAQEASQWRETAKATYAGILTGDLDTALRFLRRPAPNGLPRHVIPFLQAICWKDLGDNETALHFMKESERHDPHQAVGVLHLLKELERTEEAVGYAHKIVDNPSSTPEEIYVAAAELLPTIRELPSSQSELLVRNLTMLLERAIASYENSQQYQHEFANFIVHVTPLLGTYYEMLGRPEAASSAYDRALARHPDSGDLYMYQGMARFNEDPAAAAVDFAKAVELGTFSASPYLFTADLALRRCAFGKAQKLASAGLHRLAPPKAQAKLLEILAIATAQNGGPTLTVQRHFEEALKLDPMNEEIRRNLELAKSHVAGQWSQPVSPDTDMNGQYLRNQIYERAADTGGRRFLRKLEGAMA